MFGQGGLGSRASGGMQDPFWSDSPYDIKPFSQHGFGTRFANLLLYVNRFASICRILARSIHASLFSMLV